MTQRPGNNPAVKEIPIVLQAQDKRLWVSFSCCGAIVVHGGIGGSGVGLPEGQLPWDPGCSGGKSRAGANAKIEAKKGDEKQ